MNYQKELEAIIELNKPEITGSTPKKLLLHSCCAPCSSYVIEYLSQFFLITVFYYNPNITDGDEYQKRAFEQKKLISEMPTKYPVEFINADYVPDEFYQIAKGLENCKEGGERCFACYELRLRETARIAKTQGYDYFTTTLTISPLKNAEKINEIGKHLEQEWGVSFLFSDFKKKNGTKRSTELSKEYNLYRQDYCGCVYSKVQRDIQGNRSN